MKRKRFLDGAGKPKSLAEIGRKSYVSRRGIENLLKELAELQCVDAKTGLARPLTVSRTTLHNERKNVGTAATKYGQLARTISLPQVNPESGEDEDPVEGALASPLACLYDACSLEGFSALVEKTLRVRPCSTSSPWKVILYSDEISPGTQFKEDSRKNLAVYWTFLDFEFGQPGSLSHEDVWFTGAIVRSTVLERVPAKSGYIFKVLLLDMFPENGPNLKTTGIQVDLFSGKKCMIIADHGITIADEMALKDCLNIKGHAGLKPCGECSNMVMPRRGLEGPGVVTIEELDDRKWQRSSDERERTRMRKLHDLFGQISAEDFVGYERSFGLTYNAEALLLDRVLRFCLVSTLVFDWAHVWVVNGLLDMEVGQCFGRFSQLTRPHPVTYKELGRFVCRFSFPKSAPSVKHLFTDKAIAKHLEHAGSKKRSRVRFSSSASELLTLAPVIAVFMVQVASKLDLGLDTEVQYLVAACDAVDVLQCARIGNVSRDTLRRATLDYLRLRQQAYGVLDGFWVFKHHQALHLPGHMEKCENRLFHVLALERKHRCPKKYESDHRNLTRFELSLTEECLVHQRMEMKKPTFCGMGVCDAHTPRPRIHFQALEMFPYASEVKCSLSARGQFGMLNAHDMVFMVIGDCVRFGRLNMHFDVDGSDQSAVEPWFRDASKGDARVSYWFAATEMVAIPTCMLLASAAYIMDGERCTALTPAALVSSLESMRVASAARDASQQDEQMSA